MIRPTFLGFQTALRALNANQLGINITGQNISNIETAGYSRQRVDTSAISSGSYTQKYQMKGSQFAGLGVNVGGVSQIRDPFLDVRFRAEASDNGALSTRLSGLKDVEKVFSEIMDENGLHNQFGEFINQLELLSVNPNSKEIATVVKTSAEVLCQMLNKYSAELDKVKEQQLGELELAVTEDVNTLLSKLTVLNQAIREDNIYGNPSNELMDERNVILDQLSQYVKIDVKNVPEQLADGVTVQRMQVFIAGTDYCLVDNNRNAVLLVNDDNKDDVRIEWSVGNIDHEKFSTGRHGDITEIMPNGIISGHLDLLRGTGVYSKPDGNSYRGIQYYEQTLNTISRTFANIMNELNSVDPLNPGEKNLFCAIEGSGEITAGNIAVSEEWMADPYGWLTKSAKLNPDLTISDTPDNLHKMIEALNNPNRTFYAKDGSQSVFTGSFQGYVSSYSGELGLDISLNDNLHTTSLNVLYTVDSQRLGVSAVNMDEEGVNLMTFQKCYNAAARLMTVLDEAIDKIINGMGIAGR